MTSIVSDKSQELGLAAGFTTVGASAGRKAAALRPPIVVGAAEVCNSGPARGSVS